MVETRGTCLICAWREHCQKRFSVKSDGLLNVICADYTKDMKIKDSDIVLLEKQYKDVAAKTAKKSLDNLVEEQLVKWRRLLDDRGEEKKDVAAGPVITVSRQPGSGGIAIARRLATKMVMDLMGGQIIQHVAESVKMSTKVVETLDEKGISVRDSWLASLFESRHLWPDTYLQHLTKVIATIGRYGNAIIIGRGAHYILPPNETFKIRVIAPLETRINNMMGYKQYSRSEAEKFAVKREEEQKAFAKKYFRADITDPSHYDMVINTAQISTDGAAQAVEIAFKTWWSSKTNGGQSE